MADINWHTVEQFYELLDAGIISNNAMRVGKWLNDHGENGMTRNHLCHGVFYVLYGLPELPDHPKGKYMALDGGPPIKWRSFGGVTDWLFGKTNPNKIALIRQSLYTVEDEWSDSNKEAFLLFPYWVPDYKITTHISQWPPQLEL
nr:hypothetical protein [candidate division Zixibacteria bacterium]